MYLDNGDLGHLIRFLEYPQICFAIFSPFFGVNFLMMQSLDAEL